MKHYEWEVPCPHEVDSSLPTTVNASDHHPLTKDEITGILNFSKDHAGDGCLVSKAQVRLTQAIPGMTCPRPIDGSVAEKKNRLDEVFVRRFRLGGTPDLVEAIWLIIND